MCACNIKPCVQYATYRYIQVCIFDEKLKKLFVIKKIALITLIPF